MAVSYVGWVVVHVTVGVFSSAQVRGTRSQVQPNPAPACATSALMRLWSFGRYGVPGRIGLLNALVEGYQPPSGFGLDDGVAAAAWRRRRQHGRRRRHSHRRAVLVRGDDGVTQRVPGVRCEDVVTRVSDCGDRRAPHVGGITARPSERVRLRRATGSADRNGRGRHVWGATATGTA
jgi:hypothetical protein